MKKNNEPYNIDRQSLCLYRSISSLLDKKQSAVAIKLCSVALASLKEAIKADSPEDSAEVAEISSTTRMFSTTKMMKSTVFGPDWKKYYIYEYKLEAKGYVQPILKVSLSTLDMSDKETSEALPALYAFVYGILKESITPK